MRIKYFIKAALCVFGIHTWGVRAIGSIMTRKGPYHIYECKHCEAQFRERW